MEIINYNKLKDDVKKYSYDVDTNMWYAEYSSLCSMDEIDVYNYLNKYKLKRFPVKQYAEKLARVYEYNEDSIIVYKVYSGANGDRGYRFYVKGKIDE